MKNLKLKEKVIESLVSVLPLTAIVMLLSITIVPLASGVWTTFLFGAMLLTLGMGFFTLGVDLSMIPMGEGIGVEISKSKRLWIPIVICLILGMLTTLAEPNLTVLAEQVPSIPSRTIIFSISIGVGVLLALSAIRILFRIPLKNILFVSYIIVFGIAFFGPVDFIAVSFDSGGVTTGPVTVPFIMALGVGLATLRSDKHSKEDSFGLVALGSIGPIFAVLLLGIFYKPGSTEYVGAAIANAETTSQAALVFAEAFPRYFYEVALALSPIVIVFILFQLVSKRYKKRQLMRIAFGFVITYVGLVFFLCGVNVGFFPVGLLIGAGLAGSSMSYLLVPVGIILGYFIVAAEPAVHVLTKQVEDVSDGVITQGTIRTCLSIAVSLSVGLAMLRILTGIPIMYFLVPGYAISLGLSFFVPSIFTGIAFDSGGVASGPMTATFLLPMAIGACTAVGGNLMTDAFGMVAMVAMTPLIIIQILGYIGSVKEKAKRRYIEDQLQNLEEAIIYFD